MFRCEICGEVSVPKEHPVRVVIKRRERDYFNPRSKKKKFTKGWEIEKEISVHLLCAVAEKVMTPKEPKVEDSVY